MVVGFDFDDTLFQMGNFHRQSWNVALSTVAKVDVDIRDYQQTKGLSSSEVISFFYSKLNVRTQLGLTLNEFLQEVSKHKSLVIDNIDMQKIKDISSTVSMLEEYKKHQKIIISNNNFFNNDSGFNGGGNINDNDDFFYKKRIDSAAVQNSNAASTTSPIRNGRR